MKDFRVGENFRKFGATYRVCLGGGCHRCAFNGQPAICCTLACRFDERKDGNNVHFEGLPLTPGILSATATATTNERAFNLIKR